MGMSLPELGTPDGILEAALSRKKDACQFYNDVQARCTVDAVRNLVERLRDEETKQVRMIEGMITNLNLGHDAT